MMPRNRSTCRGVHNQEDVQLKRDGHPQREVDGSDKRETPARHFTPYPRLTYLSVLQPDWVEWRSRLLAATLVFLAAALARP